MTSKDAQGKWQGTKDHKNNLGNNLEIHDFSEAQLCLFSTFKG